MLACALNERLADLHDPVQVPDLTVPQVVLPPGEVPDLVEELRAGQGPEDQRAN